MKKVYYIDEKNTEKFVNPYNFISVDVNRKSCFQYNGEPLLTGYLQCRLIVRTPLAIPDTGKEENVPLGNGNHKVFPFYSYDGKTPVIPGSSIRGMIRSVYEAVTDSCMPGVRENSYITARNRHLTTPGLLIEGKDNQWRLYGANRYLIVVGNYETKSKNGFEGHGSDECKRYIVTKDKKINGKSTGDLIRFIPAVDAYGAAMQYCPQKGKRKVLIGQYVQEILDDSQKNIGQEGYLFVGEYISNKHFESIFEKKGEVIKKIDAQDLEKLEMTLEIYRDEKINRMYQKSHTGYKAYEQAKKKGIIPVWYYHNDEKNQNDVTITLAAVGRKAFNHTEYMMLGEKAPCKCNDMERDGVVIVGRNTLCEACALFGTAEGKKKGSRVRFTDAECLNWTGWDSEANKKLKKITLPTLGQPRLSYSPFYLKDARGDYDTSGQEILGRKFYWHHDPDWINEEATERTAYNATMDLVAEKTAFSFKIYYDRITEKQLRKLMWVLNLNENDEEGVYCHKLGHGKPLGLGSVKIVIDEKVERIFDKDGNWKLDINNEIVQNELSEDDGICPKCAAQIRNILNFNAMKDYKVCYPYIINESQTVQRKNDIASHNWFAQNKVLRDNQNNVILQNISGVPVSMKNGNRSICLKAISLDYKNGDEGRGYNGWNNKGAYGKGYMNRKGSYGHGKK